MPIESIIRKLIKDVPEVAAKVGDRVNAQRLPDGEPLPAIVYTRMPGAQFGCTMDGYDGFVRAEYRIDIWTEEARADDARTIRDSIVQTLHCFKGSVTVDTETFEIKVIKVTDAGAPDFEEPSRRARQMVEFYVHYVDNQL